MTPRFFALHGNEITLKYAHDDEPTADDVRRMGTMLRHLLGECEAEELRLVDAERIRAREQKGNTRAQEDNMRRVEDETLP